MNFKLAKTYRYWWPVTVRVPDPETPGTFQEQQLRLQYEPLSRDQQIANSEKVQKMSLREIHQFELEQAAAQIRNWEGVIDDTGEIVPFTPDLLSQAMGFEWFRKGAVKGLTDSQNGEEARTGN